MTKKLIIHSVAIIVGLLFSFLVGIFLVWFPEYFFGFWWDDLFIPYALFSAVVSFVIYLFSVWILRVFTRLKPVKLLRNIVLFYALALIFAAVITSIIFVIFIRRIPWDW